jgi:hypothetical protein
MDKKSWNAIMASAAGRGTPIKPRYFEDVLKVELRSINHRRETFGTPQVEALPDDGKQRPVSPSVAPSPNPAELFPPEATEILPDIDLDTPDYQKTRPRPVPCTAKGLAFSGGGIRSAAVCLGALQALQNRNRINALDYLSTVSGGGYIGASLSAALSEQGSKTFPYGGDVADSPAIAHLRNFSNYLLPRERSGIRNVSENAAVVLRGLLANAVVVFATMLFFALLVIAAYPVRASLTQGSFLLRLIYQPDPASLMAQPFFLTIVLLVALGLWLVIWALLRGFLSKDHFASDTRGGALTTARILLIAVAAVAVFDLQPIAIEGLLRFQTWLECHPGAFAIGPKTIMGVLTAFSGAVSALSRVLGQFLKTSQRSTEWTTLLQRGATHVLLFFAAMALPLALWILYLYLSAAAIDGWQLPDAVEHAIVWIRSWFSTWLPTCLVARTSTGQLYQLLFVPSFVVFLCFQANGYSLHRLYRDRLSHAFLFKATDGQEPTFLDRLKLSQLAECNGPYHIINAAMNVQGSKEANRRGRDADFFMFTRDFIGSDLTLYGRTNETLAKLALPRAQQPSAVAQTPPLAPGMEAKDLRLDLATAMAISGAAISANMGANTVRLLSPTLALLNIRLGYWLDNPRDLARGPNSSKLGRSILKRIFGKGYLLLEMTNQLSETSRQLYLSDGGHIENLGVYELLKRGCALIVVVDAEADPDMAFPSLLKLERYARIDLGVRIKLPWESIAWTSKEVSADIAADFPMRCPGPHCAVGQIIYQNGATGIMVYFKSSLSGDEKDYILDYRRRFAAFPHETTGDQFFTEEQFESYRALGFHMVDGFFGGADSFSYLSEAEGGFLSEEAARAAVLKMLPALSAITP